MSDGTFVPMVESGDNNVWDASNRKRVRDWDSLRWCFESQEKLNRLSLTRDEILDDARTEILKNIERYPDKEDEVRVIWSWYSGIRLYGKTTTSAQAFLNFIKSGFDKAITFDDLRNHGVGVIISTYDDYNNRQSYTANDEAELLSKWKEYKAGGHNVYVGYSLFIDSIYEEKKIKKTWDGMSEKAKEWYVIRITENNNLSTYLLKNRRRSLHLCRDKKFAQRYATLSSVKQACEKLGKRTFLNPLKFDYEKVTA